MVRCKDESVSRAAASVGVGKQTQESSIDAAYGRNVLLNLEAHASKAISDALLPARVSADAKWADNYLLSSCV